MRVELNSVSQNQGNIIDRKQTEFHLPHTVAELHEFSDVTDDEKYASYLPNPSLTVYREVSRIDGELWKWKCDIGPTLSTETLRNLYEIVNLASNDLNLKETLNTRLKKGIPRLQIKANQIDIMMAGYRLRISERDTNKNSNREPRVFELPQFTNDFFPEPIQELGIFTASARVLLNGNFDEIETGLRYEIQSGMFSPNSIRSFANIEFEVGKSEF